MHDLCKIHEKTNPNKSHKKRLSVSDKNRPSTFNNSWTLCFGLHKRATVHFIKPSIIWKCLFCHFQNQNSTSRSAMFSWRRIFLLFPSDSTVTNYNILNVCQEHRKVANTMCEIRSMRLVCSPAVHAFKRIKNKWKTSGFALFLSDCVSLIFWHLSSRWASLLVSDPLIKTMLYKSPRQQKLYFTAATGFFPSLNILLGFYCEIIESSASLDDTIWSESFNPLQSHSSTITGYNINPIVNNSHPRSD